MQIHIINKSSVNPYILSSTFLLVSAAPVDKSPVEALRQTFWNRRHLVLVAVGGRQIAQEFLLLLRDVGAADRSLVTLLVLIPQGAHVGKA